MPPFETFAPTQEEARTLLEALVRIDTSNPPGNEEALARFVMEDLRRAGAGEECFALVPHGAGRASLAVTLPGQRSDVKVGFAAHMDTVPAGSRENWDSDPFAPVVKEGLLFGRGAADMKGGLAAMVLLCRHALQAPPPVTLRFLFTADEETGGLGITALREAGFTDDLDFLMVCEPTNCAPALCEKGVAWYRFAVGGKTSHAALPCEGVNALEEGFAYLQAAKARVEAAAPPHPLLGQNTFTLTLAEGGVKTNVLPDAAAFQVDMRLLPGAGNGPGDIDALLDGLAAEFEAQRPGLAITRSTLENRQALQSDEDHPAVAHLVEGVCPPEKNRPTGVLYFTDASLVIPFRPALPFAILGPGSPSQCHTPNEHVPLAEVAQAAALYHRFVRTLPPGLFGK